MNFKSPTASVWMLIANLCTAFILIVVGWPATTWIAKANLVIAGMFITLSVWCGAEISHKLKESELQHEQ